MSEKEGTEDKVQAIRQMLAKCHAKLDQLEAELPRLIEHDIPYSIIVAVVIDDLDAVEDEDGDENEGTGLAIVGGNLYGAEQILQILLRGIQPIVATGLQSRYPCQPAKKLKEKLVAVKPLQVIKGGGNA